jgi:hypothetical protein
MEPSPETFKEIGALCASWSCLEKYAEATIWGLLEADQRLGTVITRRLDLRARFELILQHAPRKHLPADVQERRNINKLLVIATRDRNIIIHGLINARIVTNAPVVHGATVPGGLEGPHNFSKIPCWTIFKGADAGKSFPISSQAVETQRFNQAIESTIQRLGKSTNPLT